MSEQKKLDRPELRKKIEDTMGALIAWNFPSTLGKGNKRLSWDKATDRIESFIEEVKKQERASISKVLARIEVDTDSCSDFRNKVIQYAIKLGKP